MPFKCIKNMITCTPFCKNCTLEHHPLLIAVLNCLNEAHLPDLEKVISTYKRAKIWTKDQPVPDPNTEFQYPLVHWACVLGRVHIIKWLLQNGFNAGVQSSTTKQSALHRCLLMLQKSCRGYAVKAFTGIMAVIPEVLNVKDFEGNTPFLFCAQLIQDEEPIGIYYQNCFQGILDLLDRYKSEFKHRILYEQNNDGDTVAHILARSDRNVAKIKALDKAGMNLFIENKKGISPLTVAIESGSISISRLIQKKAAHFNTPNSLLINLNLPNVRRFTADQSSTRKAENSKSPKPEKNKSPKPNKEGILNSKVGFKRRVLQAPTKIEKSLNKDTKIEKNVNKDGKKVQVSRVAKKSTGNKKNSNPLVQNVNLTAAPSSIEVPNRDKLSPATIEEIEKRIFTGSSLVKTSQKARKSISRPKSSNSNPPHFSIEEIIKKFISQNKSSISTPRSSSPTRMVPYTSIRIVPANSDSTEISASNGFKKTVPANIVPPMPSISPVRALKKPAEVEDEPSSTRENSIQPPHKRFKLDDLSNLDLSEERIKIESVDLSETVVTSSLLTVSEPSPPILHPIGEISDKSLQECSEINFSMTGQSALVKFIQQGSPAVKEAMRQSLQGERETYQENLENIDVQLGDLNEKEVLAQKETLALEATILNVMQELKVLQQKRDDKTKEHEKLKLDILILKKKREKFHHKLTSLNEAFVELDRL